MSSSPPTAPKVAITDEALRPILGKFVSASLTPSIVRALRKSGFVIVPDAEIASLKSQLEAALATPPAQDGAGVFGSSVDLSCGFSCNGVAVAGSTKSIGAVKEWHHEAGTVPYLRERIVADAARVLALQRESERLRTALKQISTNDPCIGNGKTFGDIARLALESPND